MISFNYQTDFELNNEKAYSKWISNVIQNENASEGDINYIFCTDDYLLKINQDYLQHDTYTDIISFDYSVGKELHGDIYISVDRVKENSLLYGESFHSELKRVMVHGVLHYCGYKDKSPEDVSLMRGKEELYMASFSEV
ncbi:rRNA maturation RNase YbeY [Aegicerativicinus sediminis]|uniref:rRNA maturation RNase YbeY n=1 Tax=Aegicerativicinus sediminis TaxID=2893202 RepID=UPI001E410496|nr:rRNA maturation RNase YbeY [Aegicerativicinus sediminis]